MEPERSSPPVVTIPWSAFGSTGPDTCCAHRNGTAHVVIGLNDAIVWDPAQDDSGIVAPADDGYYWIEFLVPAQLLAEAANG